MALEHEIMGFGRRLGIEHLSLPPGGILALDIDGMGRVHFERGADEVLIYLARSAPPHDRDLPRRILTACHYGKAHPIPLSGGVHKRRAVLLSRLAERGVTAASLENAVEYLVRQMNGVFQN